MDETTAIRLTHRLEAAAQRLTRALEDSRVNIVELKTVRSIDAANKLLDQGWRYIRAEKGAILVGRPEGVGK